MSLAAGESPDQEGIDGSEEDFAALSPCAKTGRDFKQVRNLRAREIRVEQEAGSLAEEGLVAGGFEALANGGADPALPDDGVGDRLAGCFFPEDGGFALVGD